MPASDSLGLDRSDGIAILTINRPKRLNALDRALLRELDAAFQSLEADSSVRGVLVTGAGDRAFAAGADLTELAEASPEEAERISREGQELFERIERFPGPVVAAVRGYALGGGCELALACHLRVAAYDARFGLPEVGLGLLPGFGGTVRLSRLVGLGRALELILTGEPVDGRRAAEIGLANRAVSSGEVLEEGRRILSRILENGPLAVRRALESVLHAHDVPISEGLRLERALFTLLSGSEDMHEGVSAFQEKRRPEFEGR